MINIKRELPAHDIARVLQATIEGLFFFEEDE